MVGPVLVCESANPVTGTDGGTCKSAFKQKERRHRRRNLEARKGALGTGLMWKRMQHQFASDSLLLLRTRRNALS